METVEALTPEWLNRALDAQWSTARRPILSVHAEALGTGQMCDSYRLRVTFADDSTATLVAKLPAADPNSRMAGLLMRAYEKEVRFYQELAPQLAVRTPAALHADIDASTGSFVLLLDDMAPATQGDQLAGCDPDRAVAALGELVNLHAPRWGDPELANIEWLLGDRGAGRDMLIGLLPTMWDGFVDRYHAEVADHVRAAGDVLFSRLASLFADHGPQTVVHGDYRLDNLLFHPYDGSVAVLDWQTCTVGSGPADAAYFVGAGLMADVRRAHEVALFEHYLDSLSAAGVAVDRSECWELYRRGTWGGLLMAVAASMLVQRTERGDAMFMAMASRHARHALDLDAADLLEA